MKKILHFKRLNKDGVLNIEMEFTPKEKIKKLILPEALTPDLAYFCGVLAGDGSIRFQKEKMLYQIKCVGNPKDEQEFYNEIIKPIIKKLFNLDITPRLYDSNTTYGFVLNSKSVVRYLTEFIGLPLGKKYDKLKVPPIFLDDNKLLGEFIAGLFDTDGSFSFGKRNYPRITLAAKSEKFIDQVLYLLKKNGFRAIKENRTYFNTAVNKEINEHRIRLSGEGQLAKWLEIIGTKHPKNITKIQNRKI